MRLAAFLSTAFGLLAAELASDSFGFLGHF
jgi:hypothetical protein